MDGCHSRFGFSPVAIVQWRTSNNFSDPKEPCQPQIRYTIRRLSDLRYLNDQTYAQRWVERRLVSRPMGQARIKAELQAKGIAETVADRVIADVFHEVGEERMARRALNARQRHGSRLTPAQSVRLLRQRGFDEETIDRIVMVARGSDEG